MTHKTGALVLAGLALTVALLGIFLAMRCEKAKHTGPSALPAVETLSVGNALAGE